MTKTRLSEHLAAAAPPEPKPVCYKLVSENLTNLGRMGARTSTNYTEYYSTVELAKIAAEKDYGKPIPKWSINRYGTYCSGDLSHVMYTISPIMVKE